MSVLLLTFLLSVLISVSSFLDTTSFESIDVKVKSQASEPIGSCDLGATLTIPNQKSKALAVLIHGSGSVDRNGTFPGGLATYKDIAEHLSKNGIASIRFDKRSSIRECAIKMNSPKFTYKVFVNDVRNVIEFAQHREALQNLPTVLIGHSQGVNFATDLASDYTIRVDGIVLLAGLGEYAIDETIIRQLKGHLDNPQLPDETREQYEKLVADGEVFFQKVRSGNYLEEDFFMGAFAPFWSEYISYTEQASFMAGKVSVPTLVLQGEQDTNVIRADFDALVGATKHVNGSKAIWVPDCHHLLAIPPSTSVAPVVLNSIRQWIEDIL